MKVCNITSFDDLRDYIYIHQQAFGDALPAAIGVSTAGFQQILSDVRELDNAKLEYVTSSGKPFDPNERTPDMICIDGILIIINVNLDVGTIVSVAQDSVHADVDFAPGSENLQ